MCSPTCDMGGDNVVRSGEDPLPAIMVAEQCSATRACASSALKALSTELLPHAKHLVRNCFHALEPFWLNGITWTQAPPWDLHPRVLDGRHTATAPHVLWECGDSNPGPVCLLCSGTVFHYFWVVGQPLPPKTLLHNGPTQGTCRRELTAEGHLTHNLRKKSQICCRKNLRIFVVVAAPRCVPPPVTWVGTSWSVVGKTHYLP